MAVAQGTPSVSNVTLKDVATYIGSLIVKDTPWSIGCAAVLTSVWSDRCLLEAENAALSAQVVELQAKLKFLTENCDCKEIV